MANSDWKKSGDENNNKMFYVYKLATILLVCEKENTTMKEIPFLKGKYI